jgi:phosphate transport system permease protein
MSPARPEAMRSPLGAVPARGRRVRDLAFVTACHGAAAIVLVPLVLLVWHLVARGAPGLNAAFFTQLPKPVGEPGGGMANAIVGTLMLVGIGTALAVPVGVGAGIFLSEYARLRLATVVRYTADVLAGVPSIVVGVAAYGLVVVPMHRFSALAGGVALGILMLPTIVRATEEVVRLVPQSYRHAALALGAPEWHTVQQVVLPAALPGIVTAVLLALGRAAGETAPLLFTALGNRFWSVRIDQPIASLPVFIFDYARAPYPDWNAQAWTAALVLLLLVTTLSLLVRFTTGRTLRR